LDSAYSSLVAERRENARKAEIEKQVKEAEKRGFEAGRTASAATPYSAPNGSVVSRDSGPSTLSGLTKHGEKSKHGDAVSAAVATFHQLRSGVST